MAIGSEPQRINEGAGRSPTMVALSSLLLDEQNPRFGYVAGRNLSQADIVDHIVETFGVDDVLSSLAVNGYFAAEPMVCRKKPDENRATVMEGNRRLAACLILTGDERASRQRNRTEQFGKLWVEHGKKSIDPIPVILFDGSESEKALLSYLGVRHIASAQPWDSYAKAAWVAKVVEDSELTVADVALMIGDQHRTIQRLLEGYYFVRQAIEEGHFRPGDSVRRGRGSVTDYPFSWVYTILGYSTVRRFLEIDEDDGVRPTPLKPHVLPRAGVLTRAMFGDRSAGRNAAINDSRQIGSLASVLADEDKVALLEAGKTVDEIERLTQPIDQRLRQALTEVRTIQSDVVNGIIEQALPASLAQGLISLATINKRTAADLERRIIDAAAGIDD